MEGTPQVLEDLPKVIRVGKLSYGRHTRCRQRPKCFTATPAVRLWLCNSRREKTKKAVVVCT